MSCYDKNGHLKPNSPCGRMRSQLIDGVKEGSPKKIVNAAVKAIHYNTLKVTKGEAAANKRFTEVIKK